MALLRRTLPLALSCLLLLAPAAAAETSRTIADSGTERDVVANDAARVVLGVSVRRATATQAVREAGARIGRVLGVLGRGGVARADLATQGVSVHRAFRRRRFLGYDASTSVRATVRRVGSVSTLVPAAIAAGATSLDEVSFYLSHRKAAFRFALAAAIDDARAKAEILASRTGLTLGLPLEIHEGDASFDDSQSGSSAPAPAGGGVQTPTRIPTRPGTTTVQADVSVRWEASPAP